MTHEEVELLEERAGIVAEGCGTSQQLGWVIARQQMQEMADKLAALLTNAVDITNT